jgi:phage virion morphogenesis protein
VITPVPNQRDVQRLTNALNNFRAFRHRFNHDLPRRVLGWTKERMRTRIISEKQGPNGEKWPDAADGSPRASLLYKTRKLVNSFKSVFASGAGILGNTHPAAALHHFGGLAGARNRRVFIPARPYFGIGYDDEKRLEDIIQQWVDRNRPA